ncbi:MAG: cytochrome P450 [Microthrixaceae bacterium]
MADQPLAESPPRAAGGGLPQIDLLNGYLYAADPDPTYRWLRDNAPVYRDEINDLWGISRYDDVVMMERNPERYSSLGAFRPVSGSDPERNPSMINLDDPRHLEHRRLIHRRFTPRAVAARQEQIGEVVDGLVSAVEARIADGEDVDAVEHLAAPLPAMMIAEDLGFGADRWRDVKRWSELTVPLGGGDRYFTDEAMEAVFEVAVATAELIEARRSEPTDDLVSVWSHAEVDGRPMNDNEIVSECLLTIDGGAETTRTVLATTLWALAEHPEQRSLLRERPELLEGPATEEFIRWTTPILNMSRVVTEGHELGGCRLNAGDKVLLMYSSANRDERVFDQPERFDVTREHNHHVAFGLGTHFCLGSSLARAEIRTMIGEVLSRLPDWALSATNPPRHIPGAFVRGVDHYTLEF